MSTPAPAQRENTDVGYGAQFWLMNNTPGVPEDTYFMSGNRGQYVVISPSLNAVIVRRGYDVNGGARFEIDEFARDVLGALQASQDARMAIELENAAIEAEIEATIEAERARSQRARDKIRARIMSRYGRE